jgi:hypothetical protein
MFASPHLFLAPRHPLFSVDTAPGACPDLIGAFKSPLRSSTPPRRPRTTQLLPSFSTPSEHAPQTNARCRVSLHALLHASRCAPDSKYDRALSAHAAHPTALPLSSTTPFDATLANSPANTHSKVLKRKLSPLDTTFTKKQGVPVASPPWRGLSNRRYTLPQSIGYTIPPRHP